MEYDAPQLREDFLKVMKVVEAYRSHIDRTRMVGPDE